MHPEGMDSSVPVNIIGGLLVKIEDAPRRYGLIAIGSDSAAFGI